MYSSEVTLVHVENVFDFETGPTVRSKLLPILKRQGHVILDLRGAMLDSSGLGTVLSMQRRLELQGRLLLVVAADKRFISLLERTGVRAHLQLFRDTEAAFQYARAYSAVALAA